MTHKILNRDPKDREWGACLGVVLGWGDKCMGMCCMAGPATCIRSYPLGHVHRHSHTHTHTHVPEK